MVLRLNFGSGYSEIQQDITGATVVSLPTTVYPGRFVTLFLDQDGTGSHNITFDAEFNFPDGFTLPVTDAANKRRVMTFLTTTGNTLVYNVDYTTDVPVNGPQDFFANFKFDNNGTDSAGYFPALTVTSEPGNAFGIVGTGSEIGIVHTGASIAGESTSSTTGLSPTIDFTFSAWMEGELSITVKGSTPGLTFSSSVTMISPTDTVQFRSSWYYSLASSSSNQSVNDSSAGVATGVHHIAVVRESTGGSLSNKKIYVDGVEIFNAAGQTAVVANIPLGGPSSQDIGAFRYQMTSDPSRLDEVQLFRRALTPTEIDAIFQSQRGDYGV